MSSDKYILKKANMDLKFSFLLKTKGLEEANIAHLICTELFMSFASSLKTTILEIFESSILF